MTTNKRIPVTVLTGFLGAGKTTILNHLMRQPEMRDALVIINEFGEVGLDHQLVAHASEDTVVELSSGCLCCTIRGDLVKTLRDVGWRYARNGERWFSRVVIETTGLADPAPIIHTLMTDGHLADRYVLDGVVTVVDLVNAANTLDQQPEAIKQVAMADALVLTKADLVDATARRLLDKRLALLNPSASKREVRDGRLEPDFITGLGLFNAEGKIADVAGWLKAEAYANDHADHHSHDHGHHHGHHHEHDHSHDPNRHGDNIHARCFVVEQPLEPRRVDALLEMLLMLAGSDLLRVKGILNLRGSDRPLVIHGVQHIFHPPATLDDWPDDDRSSKLVFITRGMPNQLLEDLVGSLGDGLGGR
ncbi:MAG: GTP-binding protein [Wenzhouxiangella sp.]|nr:MAG: GTP-binding protein [Wenzhouxiangella sp.]